MSLITRTVHGVRGHAVKIERVEGEIKTEVLDKVLFFPRNLKEKELEKIFIESFKKDYQGYCRFTMESFERWEEVRGLDFDFFLANSVPVTRPTSQQ